MNKLKTSLKLLLFIFLLLIPAAQSIAATKKPIEFVIVTASYNNENWCVQNIESVFNQTYSHWSLIYLNDCSTDRTGEIVDNYFREHDLDGKCILINNETRVGAMANYYHGIMLCPPHKVVATLDGDDWLAHPRVLEMLAEVYADKTVWVTHGNFTTEPFIGPGYCKAYPEKVLKKNAFRKYRWLGAQLRTFYAKLFHRINPEDLKWNGEFVPMTSDLAFMFPILEMASLGHIHYVNDIIYVVNTDNPISDVKKNSKLQLEIDRYLRTLRPYKPLKKL